MSNVCIVPECRTVRVALKDSFWLFEPDAGIKHVLEHLGPPIESWWCDLADTSITPKVIEKLGEGVNAELKPLDLSSGRSTR